MARSVPDRAQILALLERLGEEGLHAVWVDRAPVFDRTTLLHALYQSLELPTWFGFNWDALEDVLRSGAESDPRPRVLVFRDFSLLEERDPASAALFLDIVRSVTAESGSALSGVIHAGEPESE